MRGVAAAVFPGGPERDVFNNALLDRDLGTAECAAAIAAMAATYDGAGIERYAAWVHERDERMRAALSGRGYTVEESTRAMGMPLAGLSLRPPEVELAPPVWAEYLRILEVPAGLLGGADPDAFHILVARLAGESVATAMAFDHDGDCGVFNVSTLEPARRRGLGTALTARHVLDAAGARLLDGERAVDPDGGGGLCGASAFAISDGSSSTCRRRRRRGGPSARERADRLVEDDLEDRREARELGAVDELLEAGTLAGAVHDQPAHREVAVLRGLERERHVVDGAPVGPADDHEGQPQRLSQVGGRPALTERGEQARRALDEHAVAALAEREVDLAHVLRIDGVGGLGRVAARAGSPG